MNLPPLFLRFAHGGPWLVVLIVILLALWGLAEMHDRQRQLAADFCGGLVREEEWLQQLATSQRRMSGVKAASCTPHSRSPGRVSGCVG